MKKTLIDRFTEALGNDCGAFFVGSENDDLPMIAQYIVNQCNGNRRLILINY